MRISAECHLLMDPMILIIGPIILSICSMIILIGPIILIVSLMILLRRSSTHVSIRAMLVLSRLRVLQRS